ncbi:MAG TPA: hypothetical protein PK280_11400 [Planctomycetota bacterium]|nr:hypothetical protein [Planctomycetota bacterium]
MNAKVKVVSCVLLLGLLATVLPAAAWEIPLTVKNDARSGLPPFVSGGVPLVAGQAKETGDLRLAYRDREGKLVAIPAQFRVLARYWRGDPSTGSGPGGNSIRWVLVDYATGDVPGEKVDYATSGTPRKGQTVVLTDAKLDPPAGKPAVTVQESDDAVVISTGVAKFTVSKRKFNLLQSAVVDGEELLDPTADQGVVVEDTYGEKYYGSEGAKSVAVLESGPVRACIRAQGRNLARDGKGYSRGMYGYDVFMNFHAGSADLTLDVVFANNAQKAIGSPTFEDASLLVKLSGGATGCRVYGAGPLDSKLAAGESVCLYQDSNGAETWEQCPGYSSGTGGRYYGTKTVSFRGYRVLKRSAGKEEVLSSGDQARGVIHIFNEKGGAVLLMRNFWQQFPKAVEASADGVLRLGMFPRECVLPHYLEDASGKGHEVVLHFYAKGKAHGAADENGRTWPHWLADAWDPPAFPRPTLEHQGACGALADLGPYTPPTSGFLEYNTPVEMRRMMMTDKFLGNGLGWQVYGERWTSHGGHSTHGARQPVKEDCFLFRWYFTGDPGWLDVGINRSRLYRDVRQYRIDDQDALAFGNWNEFRQSNLRETGFCSRPVPQDDELKKHRQGFWGREPWELPNPEHTTLDLLYDRYLLFGDQRAFENMRIVAANGAFYAIAHSPKLQRDVSSSWRAFHRYWELTGDKRAGELYKELYKANAPLLGKPALNGVGETDPKKAGTWTVKWDHVLAMAALHTGDPQWLELAKTAAEQKEECGGQLHDLFAVLYHLTGEQKYKDWVLKKTYDGNRLLRADLGEDFYFPPTSHWLLNQPPKTQK